MWEFLWGALFGGVVGVFLERLLGRPLDSQWQKFEHSRALRQGKSVADLTRRNSELLAVGSDLIYVHAFYPAGVRLTTRLLVELRLEQRWKELPTKFGPAKEKIDGLGKLREEISADPSRWNESRLGLTRLNHGRNEGMDIPTYELVFHPTDYAATRFTEDWWQSVMPREDLLNLGRAELAEVFSGMSHSFGTNATVVTDDGQLILVHRSGSISSQRSLKHISVNEGMKSDDLDSYKSPDVVAALQRGICEELGIATVPQETILLHSIILDATRYQWAVLGHVDLRGTGIKIGDVDALRRSGMAVDHWENDSLYAIPFTAEAILAELADPSEWIAHGWVNLLLSAMSAFPKRANDFLRLLPRVADESADSSVD